MATDLETILRLEVPLVVVLAERRMLLSEIRDLVPGTIIELPKNADDELEIRVNNRAVGTGSAVKVGENFGIRMDYVGELAMRAEALARREAAEEQAGEDEVNPEDLAAALLSGQ
ncbi:MAG: FliM/FliN family flagellar motor switch protein [Planctomycetota bacterium]